MVKATLLLSVAALAAVGSAAPHVRRGVSKYASGPSNKELVARKSKAYLEKRDRSHAIHKRALATRNITEHLAPVIDAAKTIEVNFAADGGGAVVLTDDFEGNGADLQYWGAVDIGTPGQTFKIDFDTGSADTWVPAPGVIDGGGDAFDPDASSTSDVSTVEFADQYGTGAIAGVVAQDTVTVGGIPVEGQIFGLATQVDAFFQEQMADGLMGVAFSTLSQIGAYTPFENMLLNSLVTQPYYSIALAHGAEESVSPGDIENAGIICFGCLAVDNAQGDVTWLEVVIQAYWEIVCDGVVLNGQLIEGTETFMMVDSGTSFLYLPTAIATAVLQPLGGQQLSDGSWAIPVSANIQDFGLAFGGIEFPIDLEDLILGYADEAEQYAQVAIFSADQPDPAGNYLAVAGDLFMKNVLSLFSYSTAGVPAVGFVPFDNVTPSRKVKKAKRDGALSLSSVSIPTGAQTPGILTTSGTGGLTHSVALGTGVSQIGGTIAAASQSVTGTAPTTSGSATAAASTATSTPQTSSTSTHATSSRTTAAPSQSPSPSSSSSSSSSSSAAGSVKVSFLALGGALLFALL